MKRFYHPAVLMVVAAMTVVLGGCGRRLTAEQAVQVSAAIVQGVDIGARGFFRSIFDTAGLLRLRGTHSAVTATQEIDIDEISEIRQIDRTIDLDMQDPVAGVDLFPCATGRVRLQATAGITGLLDGVLEFDPVAVTYLTDVVVTDSTSEVSVTWREGTELDYSAEAGWSITDMENFEFSVEVDGQVQDKTLVVEHPEYLAVRAARVSGSFSGVLLHTRSSGEGETTCSLNADYVIEFSALFIKHTLEWAIAVTDDEQIVTITFDGETLGTYTLSELAEAFGVNLELYPDDLTGESDT